MVWSVLLFGLPVLLSPLLILIISKLTPVFIDLGTQLFVETEYPKVVVRRVGKDIGVRCVVIYVLCWSAAYGCHLLEWPYLLSNGICIAGIAFSLYGAIALVRNRIVLLVENKIVRMSWTDSMLIGIIAYTGGNLPLFIIIPLILILIPL